MSGRLDWARDGWDWPNRQSSRFLQAGGIDWHVQTLGSGPPLLLLHGTGASTHSWRCLAPLLARHFSVVAPDLPGHGFTGPAPRSSLPAMAAAVAALLAALACEPVLVVGHSAGAAILVQLCLDRRIAPRGLVSLNGALLPLRGLPGQIFAPVARLMVALPLVPRVFARLAAERSVLEQLVRDTGSTLDAAGRDLYARLARNPAHVAGALGMMAQWDLRPLPAALPGLQPRLLLIAGAQDRLIAPAEARRVAALVPGAALVTLPGLGHLAHEEAPERVGELVVDFARTLGVPAPAVAEKATAWAR